MHMFIFALKYSISGIEFNSMCTLTVPKSTSRRYLLNLQLDRLKIQTKFIFGPDNNGADGCLTGWIHMLNTCKDYPVLFTEDDVDLRMVTENKKIENIPYNTVLSLASNNCHSSNCSEQSWVDPWTDDTLTTYGSTAFLFPNEKLATRALEWIYEKHHENYNGLNVDIILFLNDFGIKVACPPLLGFVPSNSLTTRGLFRKNNSLTCIPEKQHRSFHNLIKHCIASDMVWITASYDKYTSENFPICHVHVQLHKPNHGWFDWLFKQPNKFWRQKMMAIRRVIQEFYYINKNPIIIVSDVNDIYINKNFNFGKIKNLVTHNSIVLSTEETCWVGRPCNNTEIELFRQRFPKSKKFIHSQYLGYAENILELQDFGANRNIVDDMDIIFRYATTHPDRIFLDENFSIFGSLAFKYAFEDHSCLLKKGHVCIDNKCPLFWHNNGGLSANFMEYNKACKNKLNIKKQTNEVFTNVMSDNDIKKAMTLLKTVTEVLAFNKVDYMVDGGTLIGAMINNSRLPWDDDFDILVPLKSKSFVLAVLERIGLKTILTKSGYAKVWDPSGDNVDNKKPWGYPFVDIGILASNSTHVYEVRSQIDGKKYSNHVYKKDWIFPTRTHVFEGLHIKVPNNPDAMLSWRLRKQWKTFCVAANYNHKFERPRFHMYDGNHVFIRKCDQL